MTTSKIELPTGLPDPSDLASWAGQFFPEFASAVQPLAAAPRQTQSLPVSEQDLAALVQDLAVPSAPQGLPDVGDVSGLSFLDEVRAFGDPKSQGDRAAARAQHDLPTRSPAPEFPSHPARPLPEFPVAPTALGTPGTAATVPYGDFAPRQTASFLQEARPVETAQASPVNVPGLISPTMAPAAVAVPSAGLIDIVAVRRDFPILSETVNGKPLIWLDNAATTQKPRQVIDRLSYFYEHENSNIHRAAHTLAARSTDAYEAAREKTRQFVNAASVKDIIFVRGATEGINLVAQTYGRQNISQGDEIIVSHLEHHANIVPWQMLCAEKGARLRVIPVDDKGQLLLDEYGKLLNAKTKLVAVTQVSNALGTVTPVHEITAMAHRVGAKVLIDGAQSVSHMRVDVQSIGCDFFVFSGHKVFAPTGIGVVYGRPEVLEQIPPWHGGGNMIQDVTFEKTVYHPAPAKFEAGTGNIADAVGLGAAIDYVNRIGMENIARYEHYLLEYGMEALRRIPGVRLIGTAQEKASVLSFVLDGFRTEDVGAALSREGIAVRSGHHCAQPILRRFGLEATVRPSLAFYNTCEEIDALVATVWNLKNGHRSIV
jgi:cysteine desulfurase / selenocysteine lyase